MTPPPPSPSRWAVALLRLTAAHDKVEAWLGDVAETFNRRQSEARPPRSPRAWMTWRVLRYTIAATRANLPRFLFTGARTAKDAWRALRAAPATTALIFVTLALAIGASTVTFSVVDTIVLRQLPFDHSDELVVVSDRGPIGPSSIVAPQEFLAWRDQSDAAVSLAALRCCGASLRLGSDTVHVNAAAVTASLFDVLRTRALFGRTLTVGDEITGAEPVVVLGFEFWQRQFGGDKAALDRTLDLDGTRRRIVGVMPREFSYPIRADPMDAWTPYVFSDRERTLTGNGLSNYLITVGRLRPDISAAQAGAELDAALASIRQVRPQYAVRAEVTNLYDSLVGRVRGWLLLVLATVAVVLLVGCINVANLLLTRSTIRARELAVRAALGASRRQLALSMLAESFLLALGSAAGAIGMAMWGVTAAKNALPAGLARSGAIALDVRVLVSAIGCAMVTGLLIGSAPAWVASRTDVIGLLKDAAQTMTPSRRRWRTGFLVAEIAFVGALLAVAALFVTSFIQVSRLDLGFNRSNLIAVSSFSSSEPLATVTDSLRKTPGVTSVSGIAGGAPPLISAAGFKGGSSQYLLRRPETAGAPARTAIAEGLRVESSYFATAGMTFVKGRAFDDAGLASSTVVLDEVAARTLFGEQDPVGQKIGLGDESLTAIAGVVAHVRVDGPEREFRGEVYFPEAFQGPGRAQLLIRTSLPASRAVPAIRATLARWLPPQSLPDVTPIDDAFRRITADRRFNAGLMSIFGVLALLIGASGVYGVMASMVAQQRREFGVRVALGANARQIQSLVIRLAARHLLLGLGIGLSAALCASRVFASELFGVRPTAPFVYVAVAALVVGAGLVAAIIPAHRASRIDPIVSLRAE